MPKIYHHSHNFSEKHVVVVDEETEQIIEEATHTNYRDVLTCAARQYLNTGDQALMEEGGCEITRQKDEIIIFNLPYNGGIQRQQAKHDPKNHTVTQHVLLRNGIEIIITENLIFEDPGKQYHIALANESNATFMKSKQRQHPQTWRNKLHNKRTQAAKQKWHNFKKFIKTPHAIVLG
jgi:hypothetical protein